MSRAASFTLAPRESGTWKGARAVGLLLRFLRAPAPTLLRIHEGGRERLTLRLPRRDYAFVASPALLREVLGAPDRFPAHDARSLPVRPPPGSSLERLYAGLHQMNGETHARHRRLVAGAFQRDRVLSYAEDVALETDRELDRWIEGARVDVKAAMRRIALGVAFRTLLGLRARSTVCALLERWLDEIFRPASALLPFDLPGLPYRHLLALSRALEREIRSVIDEKRRAGSSATDVLASLLAARDADGGGLTEDELIGQTAALFVAGHALSAHALAWTLFLLSQHAAVGDALAEELETREDAPAALDAAPLLDGVVRESLRILPPVAFWSRWSASDCELGGQAVSAGTVVILSFLATHRIPEIYPEPARFRPERWSGFSPEPYAYVPFSAGPRGCVGASFAMLELKVALARILRRFRPALGPDRRVDWHGLVLSSPRRLVMRVDPAKGRGPSARARGSVTTLLHL